MKKLIDLFGKKTIKELNEELEHVKQFDAKLMENLDFETQNGLLTPQVEDEKNPPIENTPSMHEAIDTEKIAKIKKESTKNNNDEKDYIGHRARLRKQAMMHGAHTLKDYELLELLLTYSIPRADTKPLAKKLLNHFSSLKKIMLTEVNTLAKMNGIGESTLCFLHVVHEVCCRMALDDIANEVLLNSPDKVINYCKLRMSGLQYEQFRVLFLNRKNKLIFDEEIQSGTIDKAAVFPRELVKRAIEVGAGAIILIHNHPSGDPTPSKADIETTVNIQKAANLMEIFLYDHIIIGKNQHYSMRSNNIIT